MHNRLHLAFVTVLVPDAHLKLVSTACTRGSYRNSLVMKRTNQSNSGAATTASRLGQPDLAIATMNDFVGAAQMVCSLDPSVPVIADADTGWVPFLNPKTWTSFIKKFSASVGLLTSLAL